MRNRNESYFDGAVLEHVAYQILVGIVSFFTLGLLAPWVMCMFYKWEASHTTIDGKRLQFEGTGASLFGNWIKWILLSIITLGIYGFVLPVRLKQWIVKNTNFVE